jgi:hypothetical protein
LILCIVSESKHCRVPILEISRKNEVEVKFLSLGFFEKDIAVECRRLTEKSKADTEAGGHSSWHLGFFSSVHTSIGITMIGWCVQPCPSKLCSASENQGRPKVAPRFDVLGNHIPQPQIVGDPELLGVAGSGESFAKKRRTLYQRLIWWRMTAMFRLLNRSFEIM